MVNKMEIAAAIVTFNRLSEVQKTILAVFREGIAFSDIYVFDNCSIEQGYSDLNSLFPGIQCIRFNENRSSAGGFSEAMNIALNEQYDWVWLFNDDSRPIPGALESLIPFLKSPASFSIIQIGAINSDGYSIKLKWKGVRVPVKIPNGDLPVESDLVTFDGCMISTDLIRTIGPCDPEFFMGTYEFEFCLQAKNAGFKIAILPNGKIEDGKLGSVGGLPPWREYYNTRNHLWLAISRRDFQIFRAWLWRELKFLVVILFIKNKKGERLLFKFRAVRDAMIGRRGRVY